MCYSSWFAPDDFPASDALCDYTEEGWVDDDATERGWKMAEKARAEDINYALSELKIAVAKLSESVEKFKTELGSDNFIPEDEYKSDVALIEASLLDVSKARAYLVEACDTTPIM